MGAKDRLRAAAVAGLLLTGFPSAFAQNWTLTSAPITNWNSIAMSANGNKLVATINGGPTYTSTNSGITWAATTFSKYWRSVSSSADGAKLAACAEAIYTCDDSGFTWTPTGSPISSWNSVALSADGNKLFAAANGGGIYTWQTTPTPVLNITPSGSGLLISWIVPSMPFALQENADLNTSNWTAVPMTPTLNLTNLHHEVTVPLSGTNRFYRLQHL